MATADNLPEGTDSIIAGASDEGTDEHIDAAGASGGRTEGSSTFNRFTEQTAGLRSQAFDKARDYATQGKDRATDALEGLSRVVGDTARTVDQTIGAEYGDYARRAADAVTEMANNLRGKDVEELYDDARTFVRNSPALAIGVAAVVGFGLVRLIKSASVPDEDVGTSSGGSDMGANNSKASVDRASAGRTAPKKSSKPAA